MAVAARARRRSRAPRQARGGRGVHVLFRLPGDVNCELDWANTHAPGMAEKHALLGFEPGGAGYYAPGEPGFWRSELTEAKYAGLDFLLLNTYGPDIENGKLRAAASSARRACDDPVKLALLRRHLDLGRALVRRVLETEARSSDTERSRGHADLRREVEAVFHRRSTRATGTVSRAGPSSISTTPASCGRATARPR